MNAVWATETPLFSAPLQTAALARDRDSVRIKALPGFMILGPPMPVRLVPPVAVIPNPLRPPLLPNPAPSLVPTRSGRRVPVENEWPSVTSAPSRGKAAAQPRVPPFTPTGQRQSGGIAARRRDHATEAGGSRSRGANREAAMLYPGGAFDAAVALLAPSSAGDAGPAVRLLWG